MSEVITLERVEGLASQLSSEDQLLLVSHLARQLSDCYPANGKGPETEKPGTGVPRLPRGISERQRELLRETFDEIMRELGIENVEPVEPEELQARMLRHGIRPEDNLLSRGIIEMREE